MAIALGCLFLITNPQTGPRDAASAVLLTVGTFAASAFAYFVMRGLGVILTSVSWLAFFSDLRLKAVWMSLLEACVFFAAAGLMAYSLLDAVNHGSTYSAVVFAIIVLMSFWPLIRHRLRHRCWPEDALSIRATTCSAVSGSHGFTRCRIYLPDLNATALCFVAMGSSVLGLRWINALALPFCWLADPGMAYLNGPLPH